MGSNNIIIGQNLTTVREQYVRFYSHQLGHDVEILVFGDRGYPVVIFPTTWGRYFEAKDRGLVGSVHWFVNEGLAQVYCVDAFTNNNLYNRGIHPADRIRGHIRYDQFLQHEFIPQLQRRSPTGRVCVTGASFGAYQAANFAFRHPEQVSHLFCMSGAYDIKSFMDGYYDDNVYFSNPVDFVPGLNHGDLWRMKIILGTSEWDICLDYNLRMSEVLHQKNIPHWLDIRGWKEHDWPLWLEMLPHYLSLI